LGFPFHAIFSKEVTKPVLPWSVLEKKERKQKKKKLNPFAFACKVNRTGGLVLPDFEE
jgi:hypothetical protein